jgi:hypothetical protein
MNPMPIILLRIGVIVVALGLWFWTQRLISRKAMTSQGVGDRLHDWTGPANAWFWAHPKAADLTLIISSACIDLFGIYLIGATIFGASFRPFLGLLTLFMLRQVCQGLCTLPIPPGMIWRDPGFPSLLVTYGTSNDLFFSGHTAIAVLCTLELAQVAPVWVTAVAAVIAVLEMTVVIVLRAHYTIDVFAAVFTAWCCDSLAGQLAPLLRGWFHG